MRVLRIFGPMLLAALPAASGAALDPGDYPDRTLDFDGVERAYDLRVPAGYDGATPIPLVVDLHGLGSSKAGQQALSGMAALADIEGFAVVWPDGRFASWNAGWCCGQAVSEQVRDVAFLRTLVEAVAAELAVDRTRVYATGLSNGGAMTQRLACEAADVFAAAAAMAFPIGLAPITSCAPSRPIAVLTVQAPTDTLVPYEGGGLFPSAAESFAHWRAHDACGPGDPEQQVVEGESRCDYDTGCAAGVEVGLCTVA
jgi:polyhydroxybutyrate depolymerase